jgi:hypothetical protein
MDAGVFTYYMILQKGAIALVSGMKYKGSSG